MKKECIDTIINALFENSLDDIEKRNAQYKAYLKDEEHFKKFIEALDIPSSEKNDLDDLFFMLVEKLPMIFFVEGLKASQSINGFFSDKNLKTF